MGKDGKDGKDNGGGEPCTYVLGIPIHETEDCRRRRKAAKYNYKEEKQDTRQSGKTDRSTNRNGRKAVVAEAGGDPGPDANDYLGTILGSLGPILGGIGSIANPLSGIFGGGSSSADDSSSTDAAPVGMDLTPIAIAAGAGVLLLLWSSK